MKPYALLVGAAAVLALSACGDDEPEQATPTPTAVAPPTDPVTEPPETEPPAETREERARTYRIKEGDTLSEIAQRFNTTVRALRRLNDIDDPHDIRAGDRLRIPPE